MTSLDALIRSLYELSQEQDWQYYRVRALARVALELGAHGAAWVSRAPGGSGPVELTVFPAPSSITARHLLKLPLEPGGELLLKPGHGVPGLSKGAALAYTHHGNALASRVAYGFESGARIPDGASLRRITGHLVEAGALALRQYILLDERLSRLGRNNRGSAALVDTGGVIHAASAGFRELIEAEYGKPHLDRLPFTLPAAAFADPGLFSLGALRFRAVKAGDILFRVHARKIRPLDQLSPREQEIARALSAGKTFKTVAKECTIATSTVANHASRIYRKLGIFRREELMEILQTPVRAAA